MKQKKSLTYNPFAQGKILPEMLEAIVYEK